MSAEAARLRGVEAELRAVRQQLATARKINSRAGTMARAATPPTQWRQRVASLLMLITGGSVAAAAVFLAGRPARRHRWRRRQCEAEWLDELLYGQDTMTYEVVAAWCDVRQQAGWERRALRSARVFLTEHDLAEWVADVNETKGVAPKTEELRARVMNLWRQHETNAMVPIPEVPVPR